MFLLFHGSGVQKAAGRTGGPRKEVLNPVVAGVWVPDSGTRKQVSDKMLGAFCAKA
ncbi:MAG: hypothetical protein MUF86_07810 [Akkermansiaceae bacterium]|jgi:hypothetical protein|nr:hypothetical protein [Akkermansiaceae bacterium]